MRSRTLLRAATLGVLAACAQIEMPPGGPEDRVPPYVLDQRPDSMAVVPGWNEPVVFRFNERISEQGVEDAVMVSPRTSAVRVDRRSREIRVSLRRGWQPDQIYQVTIRPDIRDLFNNTITEPIQVVFSTGPEIPDTRLTGIVRDRISGEPEEDARVEAIRAADSLVYAVPSDSIGRFVFAHIPEGEYQIRAYPDRNINRRLDLFEQRDSALVTITAADTAEIQLSLVLPDSTAPVAASATAPERSRVDVSFDDYLDPEQEIASGAVTIVGPDGTPLPVSTVSVGEPQPEEQDTASAEPRLPSQTLVVQLAEGVELVTGTEYSVAASGVVNIVGLSGDSQVEFTAPEFPEEVEEEPEVEQGEPAGDGAEPAVEDPPIDPDPAA